MPPKSGITLTEIDPAVLDTPAATKDTIFMDATASPPAPAYMDSSRVVTSLIGPAGPAGPAGPTGSITVNPLGALNGDGSGGNPLGVSVDGVTIDINASNELEVLGGVTSSRQLWQYKAKTSATSGYPGNGYMLWDNATQISAANLIFSHLTTDDLDIDIFLSFLSSGSTILIQDANDSANFQKWTVSGAPTNTNPGTATSYWTAPVTFVSSGGTGTTNFPNNHQLIAVVFTAAGGSGTVTHTGTLTSGKTIVGNGGADITVSSLTGALVASAAGALSAVAVGSGVQISGATLSAKVDNETIGTDSNGKLEVIAAYLLKAAIRQGLQLNTGWLDVNVDNETIGIDSHNKLQVIQNYLSQLIIPPQGRLTLTTGTPYLVSTVTGATVVYYTPAVGSFVPLFNGTSWTVVGIGELSQSTTDTTKSPAACLANSNYDYFLWNDSGTIRCTRGPAWSTDTTRGTGAGTTELIGVSGIQMNANAITNGPAAQRGVFVGSIRTNASAQVDMIFGGPGGAGGEGTILGIWNMYNRRMVSLVNFDNTDSWTYTTDSYRVKDNNTNNHIRFVVGYQGDGLSALNVVHGSNATSQIYQASAIGLNSDSAPAAGSATGLSRSPGAGQFHSNVSSYGAIAPLGFNYVSPLERSQASGTSTWYGDNGATLDISTFTMTTMF